jgi:hypothetical protein
MKVFLLVISLFLCAITNATTYYISPSGNDVTGNGSINNPWASLKKATTAVNTPGDIIHVNPGTYIETQQCIFAVGVSLEGEGITSVIKSHVTGDFIPTIWMASTAQGVMGNQHISNIKLDGDGLRGNRAIYVGRSNVSIHDCTIVDFFNMGVTFAASDDLWVTTSPAIHATGNSFYNNTVLNCAKYQGWGRGCLMLGGQNGILVHHNTIIQNQRGPGLNGWPIKYHNNGHNRGVKIYNNTLTKNPYVTGDDWEFAIELWWSEGGMELYNNTINGSIDLAMNDKFGYPWAWYIHDNIIGQPEMHSTFHEGGIYFEKGCDGAIIENNVIQNVTKSFRMEIEDFDGNPYNLYRDMYIRKNLFKNLGAFGVGEAGSGIGFFHHIPSATFDVYNINIDNNTFQANTSSPGTAPQRGVMLDFNVNAGTVNNIRIRNNIFTGFSTAWFYQYNTIAPVNNLLLQNNCSYNNGNNNSPIFANAIPTGYINSGNIAVAPNLSPTTYIPNTGSPVIDAGLNIGLPFNGSAPDRGYAEVSLILPIKLTDIVVTENNGKNILQWKTATETNSDYFNIERSSNGQSFEVIGRVAASGSSASDINYTFTDASPLAGINYYRLSMVDKDNSSEYSKIVSTSAKKYQSLSIATAQLSVGKKNIVATVASTKNQKATLILFDATGRALITEAIILQKGLTTLNKNTGTIPGGIFYLKIFTIDENVVKNIFSTN